jgi:hypothetical protein
VDGSMSRSGAEGAPQGVGEPAFETEALLSPSQAGRLGKKALGALSRRAWSEVTAYAELLAAYGWALPSVSVAAAFAELQLGHTERARQILEGLRRAATSPELSHAERSELHTALSAFNTALGVKR